MSAPAPGGPDPTDTAFFAAMYALWVRVTLNRALRGELEPELAAGAFAAGRAAMARACPAALGRYDADRAEAERRLQPGE